MNVMLLHFSISIWHKERANFTEAFLFLLCYFDRCASTNPTNLKANKFCQQAYMIIFCTLLSLVVLSILFIFRNKPTNKQQLPSSFSIPTSEQLQYFRTIGDELSDRVVFAMEQHPKTIKDFLGMVLTCSSNDELGQACQQFVRESYKVPEWVDRERIRVAQDFYLRNMTAAGTSGFASLIESYTFADGAKVLTRYVKKL